MLAVTFARRFSRRKRAWPSCVVKKNASYDRPTATRTPSPPRRTFRVLNLLTRAGGWSRMFPPRPPVDAPCSTSASGVKRQHERGERVPAASPRQRACQVVTPRKPRAPAGNPVQPAKHPAGGGRGAAGARTFPHRPDGPGHQKRCEGNPPRLANRGRRAPIPPGGPAAPARPI